jgi:hypothetical protein
MIPVAMSAKTTNTLNVKNPLIGMKKENIHPQQMAYVIFSHPRCKRLIKVVFIIQVL